MNKIKEILKSKFNIINFRLNQENIIKNIIKGENTLAIMPTGGGKSLTYQLPSLYMDGTTIVISPLISLMKDQVESLNKKGIKAFFYNSSLENKEKENIFNEIVKENIKLLYISPERLEMTEFINSIKFFLNINLIAVDEAHCISSWGHDFRESYLNLSNIENIFPNVPILALTATADNLSIKEISEKLNIKKENVFLNNVERVNIEYYIEKKVSRGYEQVEKIIKKNKNKKGIVYCFTKDDVNKLTRTLRGKKMSVQPYHADLSTEKRTKVLKEFMNNKIDVVIATIAFGMGIDKSDIRYVIHKDIPKNIESYYQETGRAGRDGKISKTYLLYSKKDFNQRLWVLKGSNRKFIDINKFNIMKAFVETTYCKKEIIKWYFDNSIKEKRNCKKCSICKNKNIKTIIGKPFIRLLNTYLLNNEEYIDNISNVISQELNVEKHIIQDYIWQLVFSNNIIFNKENNKINLIKKINLNIQFKKNIEIDFNYEVKIIKKVKKKTIRKKSTKTTNKPKRKLTALQKKKMQDGRKRAAAKRKKDDL